MTGQFGIAAEAPLGKIRENSEVDETRADFILHLLMFLLCLPLDQHPRWNPQGGRPKAAPLVEAAEGRLHLFASRPKPITPRDEISRLGNPSLRLGVY